MIISVFRYLNHSLNLAVIIFVSLGYLLSLLFPTTILVWDFLLISALLFAFILIFRLEGNPLKKDSSHSLKDLMLALLPILIFVVPFFNILNSVEGQFSRHGDLYGAYVMEILYRTGQPDNVFVLGSVANYPWLYQALVATVSHLLGIPSPLARSIIAVYIFLSTFAWVVEVLPLVLVRKYSAWTLAMLACFVMLGINLFGFLHSMIDMWDNFNWVNIFSLIAPETFVEPARLQNGLLGKFTQYSTTASGFVYAWVCIYAAIRFIRTREGFVSLFWFTIGCAGSIAFLMAGGFLIPALLVFGYVCLLVFSLLLEKNSENNHFIPKIAMRELIYLALIWSLTLIQIYYFLSSRSATFGTVGFSFPNFTSLTMVFGNFYPLFPLLALLAFIAWKEKNPLHIFLMGSSLLALLICSVVVIRNEPYAGNEYKFILFSTFLLTLTCIPALEYLQISINNQGQTSQPFHLIKPIALILYLCVALNSLGVSTRIYEIYQIWERDRAYYYEGTSLLSQTNPYQGIFTWLRTETEQSTILVIPLNLGFDTYVLSERLPYVSTSSWGLGESSPFYEDHIRNVENLYRENPDSELWQSSLNNIVASLKGAPLAFVVPSDSPLLTLNLEDYGFSLAYQEEIASIYLYQP